MKNKSYIVDGRKVEIVDEDWNYLVILDACRFDYFNKVYDEYNMIGDLRKAISPATTTMEWLNKLWDDKYNDITYLSSSPFVNSFIQTEDNFGYTYEGSKHFDRIIDLWEHAWNKDLRTVEPKKVTEYALKEAKKNSNRLILHYMQPHGPYISDKYKKYICKPNAKHTEKNTNRDPDEGHNISRKLMKILYKKGMNFLGIKNLWRIASILNIKVSPTHLIGINEGIEGIRNAYKENLELALNSVKTFVENVESDKTVLITSDHGEFLGEEGLYGHGDNKPRKPPIVEVPWFKICKN